MSPGASLSAFLSHLTSRALVHPQINCHPLRRVLALQLQLQLFAAERPLLQKIPDSEGLRAANQTRRCRRAWLRSTGRPGIQLPWHLEEKAFWCGRQNGAVFVFPVSLLLQICPELSLSPRPSLHVCLCLSRFHNFAPFLSFRFFLALPAPILCWHFLMFLYARNSPRVWVLLVDISALHSCDSQLPSPHCHRVIRGKPDASPTEPGATDLPSTGFYLCLNATALKPQTHTYYLFTEVSHCHINLLPHFLPLVTPSLTTDLSHLSVPFDAQSLTREQNFQQ